MRLFRSLSAGLGARGGRPRLRIGLAAALLGVVAASYIAALINRPERLIGWNTPIQFDDFAFEVLDVRKGSAASGNPSPTIVSLRVHNRAKRVPFVFRKAMAVVVDDRGREFFVSPRSQAALDTARSGPAPLSGPLLAGRSETIDLAFDLPDDVEHPRLRINFGPIGTLVDEVALGRRRIALRPDGRRLP